LASGGSRGVGITWRVEVKKGGVVSEEDDGKQTKQTEFNHGLRLGVGFTNCPIAMSLSLNCLVLGDDLEKMFTVKIPKTENVSILKDWIEEGSSP
jgi:crinkler effector protein